MCHVNTNGLRQKCPMDCDDQLIVAINVLFKSAKQHRSNIAAVAATGGPGGPWPPHFLLR